MYSRKNANAIEPGRWITGDGEYEIERTGRVWTARRRDASVMGTEPVIGATRTLAAAFTLCARHYVTPVGEWRAPAPRFKCSGHGPAIEVACSFTTNDEEEAWRHFEHTSHAIDEICATCDAPCNYHATEMCAPVDG
jgi:hypothetical protein